MSSVEAFTDFTAKLLKERVDELTTLRAEAQAEYERLLQKHEQGQAEASYVSTVDNCDELFRQGQIGRAFELSQRTLRNLVPEGIPEHAANVWRDVPNRQLEPAYMLIRKVISFFCLLSARFLTTKPFFFLEYC